MINWSELTAAAWHRWVLPAWFARIVKRVTRPLYAGNEADAITFSHTTLFLSGEPPWDLQRHELQHVLQAVRYEPSWWPRWLGRTWVGTVRYGVAYLRDYSKNGYQNCTFEVEARRVAGQEE